jgi:hypothetical protein
MVAPGFGFSLGDFITGGQALIQVINAFKEVGGASSKYTAEVSFLKVSSQRLIIWKDS